MLGLAYQEIMCYTGASQAGGYPEIFLPGRGYSKGKGLELECFIESEEQLAGWPGPSAKQADSGKKWGGIVAGPRSHNQGKNVGFPGGHELITDHHVVWFTHLKPSLWLFEDGGTEIG